MEWQQSTWKRPIHTDIAQQSTDLAPQTQNLSVKKYVTSHFGCDPPPTSVTLPSHGRRPPSLESVT